MLVSLIGTESRAAPFSVAKVQRIKGSGPDGNRFFANKLDDHAGVVPDQRWASRAAVVKRGHEKTIKGVHPGAVAAINYRKMPGISLNGVGSENRRTFIVVLVF